MKQLLHYNDALLYTCKGSVVGGVLLDGSWEKKRIKCRTAIDCCAHGRSRESAVC